MTDQIEPQAEVEEAVADQVTDDAEEVQLDEHGNPVEPDDDEEEDVEFAGKTFRGPKALKERLAALEAVESKAAEVESAKQAFEERSRAEQKAFAERAALQQEFFDDINALKLKRAELARWRAYDPRQDQSLTTMDQVRAAEDERRKAIDDLRDESEQDGHALNAKWQAKQAANADQAKQAEAAEHAAFVAEISKIPGFDKRAQDIFNHAQTLGYTKAELASIRDARTVKAFARLHELETQTKSAARTQQVMNLPTPGTALKPKAAVRPLSDKSDADSWMAARNAQLKRRG